MTGPGTIFLVGGINDVWLVGTGWGCGLRAAGLPHRTVHFRWQQGLRAMLDQYAAGKETPAALQAALSIDPKRFDTDFAKYVQSQVGRAVMNLEAWQKAAKEAQQAFLDKNWKSASAAATHAIELLPEYVDENSPYLIKARASRELGDEPLATATLPGSGSWARVIPNSLTRLRRKPWGSWIRTPAPSPVVGSAPAAPRCSRSSSASSARSMTSWRCWPSRRATHATPHASCSNAGS